MVATRSKHLINLTLDEQRYLAGPILYHAGGWTAGPILPKLIPMARFVSILSGEKTPGNVRRGAGLYQFRQLYCSPTTRARTDHVLANPDGMGEA